MSPGPGGAAGEDGDRSTPCCAFRGCVFSCLLGARWMFVARVGCERFMIAGGADCANVRLCGLTLDHAMSLFSNLADVCSTVLPEMC